MNRRYCGKTFAKKELDEICGIVRNNPQEHRVSLSKTVCEALNWRKPDGGLKEMSCRVAMLRMEKDGLLKLPPPRKRNGNGKKSKRRTLLAAPRSSFTIKSLGDLRATIVGTRASSLLWNEYIDRYHYLSFSPLPGAQLRYFIKVGSEVVALLGFGASAWKVAPRDKWIGWRPDQRERNLHLVINNARFLILPWVTRKNLASKILSLITKRISGDWHKRYNYRPVLLETFVEIGRFYGTIYKASNWANVGVTQGRGKLGSHCAKVPTKSIWLYPLLKSFRKELIK